MSEQRERYKGREIVVSTGVAATPDSAEAAREGLASSPVEDELVIDGKPVFTRRASGDVYIASGFAYSPESSLVDLAKRMIDYDEAVRQEGDHGDS